MSKTKLTDNVKGWQAPGQRELSDIADGNEKEHNCSRKQLGCLLGRLTYPSRRVPTFSLLAVSSKKQKHVHTKNATSMVTAAWFLIAKNREQFRCPSVGEEISNVTRTHVMDYYSARRKREISDSHSNLDDPKGTILVERSHSEVSVVYYSITWHCPKNKIVVTENRSALGN